MPSGKLIAWIVAISLASTVALEQYRARTAGGGARPTGIRRAA